MWPWRLAARRAARRLLQLLLLLQARRPQPPVPRHICAAVARPAWLFNAMALCEVCCLNANGRPAGGRE
jgi:hypothetical protein